MTIQTLKDGCTGYCAATLLLISSQLQASEVNQLSSAQPPATAQDLFFIQISDTHVYDRKSDFETYSSPPVPWFIPDFLVPWLTVQLLTDGYGDDAISSLKTTLIEAGYTASLDDLSDTEIYEIYAAERAKEPGLFGSMNDQINTALNEVVGLQPEFIINTGDLVLESNNGSPEAIERWFHYYRSLTDNLPMPLYNTIGNNEIAGTDRKSFKPDHPQFGKHFFREHYDETYFSFDKGPFRFIALDTHSPDPTDDNPEAWNFGKMPQDVSQWLEQQLKASRNKEIVILNHEPFHFDTRWPFDEDRSSDDEGLFTKYGVDYVLSGHTHYRSEMTIDGIHHLTAGALSGMRWVLPASMHERGYRLFQSSNKELFSIWKQTHQPAVNFARPQSEKATTLTIAAADKNGPYRSVTFSVDGKVIEATALGQYFFQLPLPQKVGTQITVQTTSHNGTVGTHLLSYTTQEQVVY